jgi:hypothetical protein
MALLFTRLINELRIGLLLMIQLFELCFSGLDVSNGPTVGIIASISANTSSGVITEAKNK